MTINDSKAADTLMYFVNGWAEPLTPEDFTTRFGFRFSLDDWALFNKYLVVCKDGFIRVRTRAALLDWYDRYTANVAANYAALGIGY